MFVTNWMDVAMMANANKHSRNVGDQGEWLEQPEAWVVHIFANLRDIVTANDIKTFPSPYKKIFASASVTSCAYRDLRKASKTCS